MSTHASEVLAELPTASISDALDKLGLTGSVHGISPLRPGQRACGPAYTVAYEAVDDQGGTVGDFLDDVSAGAVVFIDNAGRTDCTVWGGIMTQVAAHRRWPAPSSTGCAATLRQPDDTDYPIWSVGRFMRTGKDRVRVRAVQEPLLVDGVTIRPGDVVCADEDGVVVVPAERVDEVAAVATGVERVEAAIVAAVRDGATLREARSSHGYHSLQTPTRPPTRWPPRLPQRERLHERRGEPRPRTHRRDAVRGRRSLPSAPGRYAMDVGIRAAWPGARVAGPRSPCKARRGQPRAPARHPRGAGRVGARRRRQRCRLGALGRGARRRRPAVRGIAGLRHRRRRTRHRRDGRARLPGLLPAMNSRGTRKLFAGALGVPVQVGAVTVCAGDLVVGDADGVVVLPRQMAERVLDTADERVANEVDIMRRLKAGESSLDIYGLQEAGRD